MRSSARVVVMIYMACMLNSIHLTLSNYKKIRFKIFEFLVLIMKLKMKKKIGMKMRKRRIHIHLQLQRKSQGQQAELGEFEALVHQI